MTRLDRIVAFRDHLRSNAEDRVAYRAGKAPFIASVLNRIAPQA